MSENRTRGIRAVRSFLAMHRREPSNRDSFCIDAKDTTQPFSSPWSLLPCKKEEEEESAHFTRPDYKALTLHITSSAPIPQAVQQFLGCRCSLLKLEPGSLMSRF